MADGPSHSTPVAVGFEPVGSLSCPSSLKTRAGASVHGAGRASAPISDGGLADLRRLLLRTLNDNQVLILANVVGERRTLTSLLKKISEESGVPLSTLKLNARILRELNMISYGSVEERRLAEVKPLGSLVLRLLDRKKEEGYGSMPGY